MNRKNIWVHIGLAVVMVTFAAVLGQIERIRTSISTRNVEVRRQIDERNTKIANTHSDKPEVMVRFNPGVTLDRIRAIASANHDVLKNNIESVSGLSVIDDLDNADAETVAAQYRSMSDLVAYAEPNFRIALDEKKQTEFRSDPVFRYFPGMPNDPQFADQWSLFNMGQDGGKEKADISAVKAWETQKGSKDVVVAVLDTGVDFTHVDLKDNMWIRPANIPAYTDPELGTYNDLNGFNGTDAIADPMDDNGHGTHCAGIIGAEGNNGEGIVGVNWHVKIMPLKFLGRGGFGSVDDAIEAINYAIDRKKNGVNIRIISASWGSTQKSQALEDVIRAAGDAGILFIAAAGNDSSNNDSRPHYPSNYDLPNVISVAALDRNDELASFSNYGLKTVHVAAPGKDILSTWLNDAYREASGTSMATPEVSGVAALVVANEPNISMKDLKARILKSVDKIASLKDKIASGGRINAAKALVK